MSNTSLYKGYILINSLLEHDPDFILYVLCMDEVTEKILKDLSFKSVILIPLKTLEEFDVDLLPIKNKRDDKEYAWTVKCPFMLYLFKSFAALEHIIYLDSDLEFFQNPKPIFDEFSTSSIMLTRERFYFQDNEPWYENYGIYNCGFMAFKKDTIGKDALKWLRRKCINWCYNRVEPNLYGDQKYTADWTKRFNNVKVSKNLGINVTAWYAHACNLDTDNTGHFIGDQPLIFYHYNGFTLFNKDEFDLCIFIKLPKRLVNMIYIPYILKLKKAIAVIDKLNPDLYKSIAKPRDGQYALNYYKSPPALNPTSEPSPEKTEYNFCSLVGKEYIPRALTLYHSLLKYRNDFKLFMCCMDDISYRSLNSLGLKNVSLLRVSKVEDSKLLSVKPKRTSSEYCWTMKPSLILYLMRKYPKMKTIFFLDSDIYFFSDYSSMLNPLDNSSILLFPQRDKEVVEAQFGKYQAGCLGFKNTPNAHTALEWWRERCIEWCSSEQGHPDKWGDQKYLDKLPELHQEVVLNDNPGINAALWNTMDNITINKSKVFISGAPLISYHFCNFIMFNENEFDLWRWPNWRVDSKHIQYIYKPYIVDLKASLAILASKSINFQEFSIPPITKNMACNFYKYK